MLEIGMGTVEEPLTPKSLKLKEESVTLKGSKV